MGEREAFVVSTSRACERREPDQASRPQLTVVGQVLAGGGERCHRALVLVSHAVNLTERGEYFSGLPGLGCAFEIALEVRLRSIDLTATEQGDAHREIDPVVASV